MNVNSGNIIITFFVIFIIVIIGFVLLITTNNDFKHQMVTENYYQKELNFQNDFLKYQRSKNFDVKINFNKNKLIVEFPENLRLNSVKGSVTVYRPSNNSLDFKKEIILKKNNFIIDFNKKSKGKWIVFLDWSYDNIDYMHKKEIYY